MPGVRFNTFSTPHFLIVYQDGLDSLARRAATVAEAALPTLKADLLLSEDTEIPVITIVVTDIDDESNGFSMPVGHRIDLFAYPMVQKTTGSLQWIDRVVVHELAHQVTYMALRKGLGLYGELWRLVFMPAWFVEGIAQFEAEEWDKNRDFLLRVGVNRGLLLDRPQLYGFMGTDFIGSRLLYEQGHSLYRFLAEMAGRNAGGRILGQTGLFNPGFNTALKKVTGRSENEFYRMWRYNVEKEYRLEDREGRIDRYAEEISAPVSGIMEQVYQLKRAGNGIIFTGIERTDVFERNLYFFSRGKGLIRLDGPDVDPFFSLSADGRIFYTRWVRTGEGTLKNRLFCVSLENGASRLEGPYGEEPCALPDGRLAFVRSRAGLSGLYVCDTSWQGEARLDLPDSVAQVFRPVYGAGRIWFSIMEFSGERKIASISPDGNDYRVEVEKAGTDLRYPAVNSRGDLVYASNEEGPFNLHVRTAGGESHAMTADPFGLFAPCFDGNDDSVLVIGLSEDSTKFGLSCFQAPLSNDRQAEAWDMGAGWKRNVALDRRQLEEKISDQYFSMTSAPYFAPAQVRPLLFYPYLRGFDFNKPGMALELGDPLEKHSISAAVNYQSLDGGAGFDFAYANHEFYPDLFLGWSRDFDFTDSTGSDVKSGGLSFPVDPFYNPRISQSIFLNAERRERWKEDFFRDYEPLVEMPLSMGVGLISFKDFTGNFIHPLDACLLSLEAAVASPAWGSDLDYTRAGLLFKKSVEPGNSRHTLFGKVKVTDRLSGAGTYFLVNDEDRPRGREMAVVPAAERYISFTGEYRLPVARDLGLSFLGLYFERTVFAPFIDFLGWIPPGTGEGLEKEKTYGVQLRQRVFFMGRKVADLGFFWAYDEKSAENHVFRFNLSPGF